MTLESQLIALEYLVMFVFQGFNLLRVKAFFCFILAIMKKTTREYFKACSECKGRKLLVNLKDNGNIDCINCQVCEGTGKVLIKETIEDSDEIVDGVNKFIKENPVEAGVIAKKMAEGLREAGKRHVDDMKEFIEKKCGWELCEGEEKQISCVPKSFFGTIQCVCPNCDGF